MHSPVRFYLQQFYNFFVIFPLRDFVLLRNAERSRSLLKEEIKLA